MVNGSWRMGFAKAEVGPQREMSANNEDRQRQRGFNPALPQALPKYPKVREIWGGRMSSVLEDFFGTRREVFRAKRSERLCGNSD
jgi:hypothetical protein